MRIRTRKTHPATFLCVAVFLFVIFIEFSNRLPALESRDVLFLLFLVILSLGRASEIRETIFFEPEFIKIERRGSEIVFMKDGISSELREGKLFRITTTDRKMSFSTTLLSNSQVKAIRKELAGRGTRK